MGQITGSEESQAALGDIKVLVPALAQTCHHTLQGNPYLSMSFVCWPICKHILGSQLEKGTEH